MKVKIKTNLVVAAMLATSTVFLGCSDNSDAQEQSAQTYSLSGVAVKGHLDGADVWIDLNEDGLKSSDEQTTTDENGTYSLDIPGNLSGNRFINVSGGTDTSTQEPFTGNLRAAFSSESRESVVVSPLSSLVASRVTKGDALSVAQEKIFQALGFSDISDITKDPIAEASREGGNSELLKKSLQVARVVELISKSSDDNSSEDSVLDSLVDYMEAGQDLDTALNTVAQAKITDTDKRASITTLSDAIKDMVITQSNDTDTMKKTIDSIESASKVAVLIMTENPTMGISINNIAKVIEAIPVTEGNKVGLTELADALKSTDTSSATFDAVAKAQNVQDQVVVSVETEPSPTPTNSTPVITSNATITVSENQTSAITLTATDADTLTYSLSGTDASSFDVNSTTGVVTFKVAPDYETKSSYTFTANVSDGQSAATQEVTITIEDVLEITSVPELISVATSIDTFTYEWDANWTQTDGVYTSDPITDDQYACMKSSVDFDSPKILSFDYNVSSEEYSDFLELYIDDNYNEIGSGIVAWTTYTTTLASGTHTFEWCYAKDSSDFEGTDSASVKNIAFTTPYFVDENSVAGTSVGSVDIGTSLGISSFTITGSGSENFEVTNSGEILVKEGATLDYETTQSYSLELFATNTLGNSNTMVIAILVNDLVPAIASAVYDNNKTSSVDDDRLFIYFANPITPSSLAVDASANYVIEGNGAIGSASTSNYSIDFFNKHTISLNSTGTQSTPLDTNGSTFISVAQNVITDTNDDYIIDTEPATVSKPNYLARLKTGQTFVYTEFDDANISRGLERSYTRDATNNTVTDNATALMWQDDITTPTTMNWEEANSYCEDLALGLHTNWRLPTLEELMSITDREASSPTIDATFVNTVSDQYWSSTLNPDESSYEPGYSGFGKVSFDLDYSSWNDERGLSYVRCVRSID